MITDWPQQAENWGIQWQCDLRDIADNAQNVPLEFGVDLEPLHGQFYHRVACPSKELDEEDGHQWFQNPSRKILAFICVWNPEEFAFVLNYKR